MNSLIKNIRYIKIIIKHNYGEGHTYINQIMLFEKNAKDANKYFLQKSLENNQNNFISKLDVKNEQELITSCEQKSDSLNYDIEKNKENIISDGNEESPNNKNNEQFNKENEEVKKYFRNKKEVSIGLDINDLNESNNEKEEKDIKKDTEKYNKNKNNKKVKKAEKFFKKSNIDPYYKKNKYLDLSSHQINKDISANTPNRIITNYDIETNVKKKIFSPNITNFNINNKKSNKNYQKKDNNFYSEEINNYTFIKNKSISSKNIKSSRGEVDYEDKLKNQLEEMENQINLLRNIENRNYPNSNSKNKYNGGGSENTNHFKNYMNKRNNISLMTNKNHNHQISPFRNNYNDKFSKSSIYKKNNLFLENSFPRNYINNYEKSQNNSFIEEISNRNANNQIQQFALNDLASNNTIDINIRIDNLEKTVLEIKNEIKSMSSILSNFSSTHFLQNNLKDQIKQLFNDYLNEKMNLDNNNKYGNKNNYRPNYNNYNYDKNNHSFYSEFLKEEDNQKNIYENNLEIKINKKIDHKLENFWEKIKNQIENNLLKPSISKLENVINKNINEIKEKINDMNRIYNIENINNSKYGYYNRKNKLLESNNHNELISLSKGNSKLRNEKYDEINRLGEKLYQKLEEKEKKLKLLTQELKNLK